MRGACEYLISRLPCFCHRKSKQREKPKPQRVSRHFTYNNHKKKSCRTASPSSPPLWFMLHKWKVNCRSGGNCQSFLAVRFSAVSRPQLSKWEVVLLLGEINLGPRVGSLPIGRSAPNEKVFYVNDCTIVLCYSFRFDSIRSGHGFQFDYG